MSNKNYKSYLPRVKYVLEENEKAALKTVGLFVKNAAKQKLDQVTQRRTGLLRKNIGYRIVKKIKSVEVGVRKKAFYARFVELGHKYIRKGLYLTRKAAK